jgi:hypothetical protein
LEIDASRVDGKIRGMTDEEVIDQAALEGSSSRNEPVRTPGSGAGAAVMIGAGLAIPSSGMAIDWMRDRLSRGRVFA